MESLAAKTERSAYNVCESLPLFQAQVTPRSEIMLQANYASHSAVLGGEGLPRRSLGFHPNGILCIQSTPEL